MRCGEPGESVVVATLASRSHRCLIRAWPLSLSMHHKPYFGTLCGVGMGVLAIGVWMLTFSKEGGVELSLYLFPLSKFTLEHLYPVQSVPVLLWYGGALIQWVVIGALVDLLRGVFRRKGSTD